MLPPNDPLLLPPHAPPHLVCCAAGDAILWDSRTVHCNTPSLTARGAPARDADGAPRPSRLVGYCSAAPRARASAAVLRQRQRAFLAGGTCTHWPFEMTCLRPPAAMGQPASSPLSEMSSRSLEKKLVGFTDSQIQLHRQTAGGGAGAGGDGTVVSVEASGEVGGGMGVEARGAEEVFAVP